MIRRYLEKGVLLWYYRNVMTKASKLLLPYEKKWVALSKDGLKVFASANNIGSLGKKLEALKIKRDMATMTWVFPFESSFAPFNV